MYASLPDPLMALRGSAQSHQSPNGNTFDWIHSPDTVQDTVRHLTVYNSISVASKNCPNLYARKVSGPAHCVKLDKAEME